jgi:hypothetical protein
MVARSWSSFPLAYYGVQPSHDSEYPLEWSFWFLAAYALVECTAQSGRRPGAEQGKSTSQCDWFELEAHTKPSKVLTGNAFLTESELTTEGEPPRARAATFNGKFG